MVRYLSWLANAALLALGCFLVANTANTVFAALLTPSPAERAPAPAPEAPTERSWADRKTILDRNLFNASLLSPGPLPPQPEELEATKLPLELLGTAYSTDEKLSWAAIQDKETRKHLVLRVHDVVKEGKATVIGIERKRVVLSENGEPRELVLAENREPAPPSRMSKRSSRRSRVARRRPSPTRSSNIEQTIANPATLLSQANLLPRFENGEMVGVQVSGIQPGSLYEKVGIKEGDVVTEINGMKITSPEESYNILREISQADTAEVGWIDKNGVPQSTTVSLREIFNR